jgi:hypothetical protein
VITTYATAGTFTWTCPPGVITAFVQCWGGGGGGLSEGLGDGSDGGAGGEYAAEPSLAVTPGNAYTVVVGAAGTAGHNVAGGNGGNTTFNSSGVVANGGQGGTGLNQPSGVAVGGHGSGNSVHYSGGNGGYGQFTSGTGGGGGGSGGTASAGNAGAPGSGALSGAGTSGGAVAVTGGGPGGGGGQGAGAAGSAPVSGPGGGGGGGYSLGSNGGPGFAGQVTITTLAVASATALDYVPSLATARWPLVSETGERRGNGCHGGDLR